MHYPTLRIRADQLLYDIRNLAYVESHVMNTDQPPQQSHIVADICEAGNIDIVYRALALAHARVQHALCQGEKRLPQYTDTPHHPKIYMIHIAAPISDHTLRLLGNLVHQYMVSYALHQWLRLAHSKAAAKWADQASALMTEITLNLTSPGVTTRKLFP